MSSTLRGVIAQRLVRRLCTHCREHIAGQRYKAVGCDRCNGPGYRSLLAVGEVLVIDDALRTMIDEQAGEAAIRRSLMSRGFQPMRAWARRLVEAGVTDEAELDRGCGRPNP